ncbi:MAG: hypothetical protein H6Q13_3174 [Bacteroidetes bacterium]|nr:hypothetical protein [Bacteroidota bacterium]
MKYTILRVEYLTEEGIMMIENSKKNLSMRLIISKNFDPDYMQFILAEI